MLFSLTKKVFKIGDSLALTVPKSIAKQYGIVAGDYIVFSIEKKLDKPEIDELINKETKEVKADASSEVPILSV